MSSESAVKSLSSNNSSLEDLSISSTRVPEEPVRGKWGNKLQFILTCLGCAVGLGNIWRLPSKAYENGGSAFLIPYLLCGLLFGLPVVYAEFFMGQYTGVASLKIFSRYAPAAQGIGWAMVFQEITVSTYYTVILTWTAVYIGYVVSGQSYKWRECGNSWNTEACVSGAQIHECVKTNITKFYDPFLKTCSAVSNKQSLSATQEFFQNYITKRSTGILEVTEINWYVAGALFAMWFFIAIALIRGIKMLGYLSYVTATVPYIIILILFVRGITLDGAWEGIRFFLEPQFDKLWNPMTWANALQQLAFSLSIGTGALMTMASYNKRDNNCFRDATIIVLGDTIMSVVGGVAVFAVLGHESLRTGKNITDLVEDGPSLAFIAYPTAMAELPLHYIWEFLFFVMFLLLGISTESVMVQALGCSLCDQFVLFRKRPWLPVIGTCSLFFVLGLIMCTDAGWYWFLVSDEFTGSTGLTFIIAITFVTFSFTYGIKNVEKDLETCFGEPRPLTSIRRWLGRQSPLWLFAWTTICPIGALIITGILCDRPTFEATINGRNYVFPTWATVFGWFTTLGPLLAIPFFFFRNFYRVIRDKKEFSSLFKPSPAFHERELHTVTLPRTISVEMEKSEEESI